METRVAFRSTKGLRAVSDSVLLLSIPGLREEDLARMPRLASLASRGDRAPLVASTPGVTCPVQANMTTGVLPDEHGVTCNGVYDRQTRRLEMWTSWADAVQAPRVWDRLREHDPSLATAAWFPLLAKGCGADYVCTPAPRHNPDGTESLWCYSKPEHLYPELLAEFGHFPLHKFWGPLAGIEGSRWIVDSLVWLAGRRRLAFAYVYLPHLDYAAQKHGPDSPQAHAACRDLDGELSRLIDGLSDAWRGQRLLWLVASEYAITPVSHAVCPNRVLRGAGLLRTEADQTGGERIDFDESLAWALADHQHAHVFVRERDAATVHRVVDLFRGADGVAETLAEEDLRRRGLAHDRSGDVVLISEPRSWMAYPYWLDERAAPAFARRVDIHSKPGYDPLEMWFDPALAAAYGGGVPLDLSLVRGSHGAPAWDARQRGVILASERGVLVERAMADIDVCELVLRQFGV